MDISTLEIQVANVVVLFDSLSDSNISRDKLRSSLPVAPAQVIDVPGFTAASFPTIQADVIIFWDNQARFEVKLTNPTSQTLALLPKLTSSAVKSIKGTNPRRYGFNIFGAVEVAAHSKQYLISYFEDQVSSISQQVEGDPDSFNFTYHYSRNGIRHQISVLPDNLSTRRLAIRLNREFATTEFPKLSELRESCKDFQSYYETTVTHLFESD